MRLALLAALAALLAFLAAAPATAQQAVPTGVWVSEDGEITLHLRPDSTYTLTGTPIAAAVTGRYVVPRSGETIVIRGPGIQGSLQIQVIEASDDTLLLASDELFGGRMEFGHGVQVGEAWLGAPIGVFIGVTLILFGGGALMTGRALGAGWRPWWQSVPYAALLGAADRFLIYGLFDGDLWSIWGYVLHTLILFAIIIVTYRLTRARAMVNQYPWIYERAGPFSWKARSEPA